MSLTLVKDFNSLNNKRTSNLVKLVPRHLGNGHLYRPSGKKSKLVFYSYKLKTDLLSIRAIKSWDYLFYETEMCASLSGKNLQVNM